MMLTFSPSFTFCDRVGEQIRILPIWQKVVTSITVKKSSPMICSVYLIVSRTASQPQISNLETTGKSNWSLHQFSEDVNNGNKLKKGYQNRPHRSRGNRKNCAYFSRQRKARYAFTMIRQTWRSSQHDVSTSKWIQNLETNINIQEISPHLFEQIPEKHSFG